MKRIFNIRSYVTFLSRNKAYALINVFGLSVSLMFVLLIGVYNMQERSVDQGYKNLDRIYTVNMLGKDSTLLDGTHHYAQKLIRQVCPDVVESGAAGRHSFNISRPDGEVIKAQFMVMDTTLFSILDFDIVQGDAHNPLPDSRSAAVSESFAKRYFGDYNPIGKSIALTDSIRYRVTAIIADRKNTSLQNADVYLSYPNMKLFNAGDMDEYVKVGINPAGMTLYLLTNGKDDLRAKEAEINEYLAKNFIVFDPQKVGYKAVIAPLSDYYFTKTLQYETTTRHGDSAMVNVLFAVGVVILLFAMINYVNLTVSQSGYRAREMATRRLFGGSRLSIITQLMGESIAMCLLSLAIAVVLTCAAAPLVGKLLNCELDLLLLLSPLPLLLTLLFVVVVGSLSGILPSMIISRTKPIEIVRGTFRFRTKMRLSRIFIVVQNVVTIVMLAAALTMTFQMRHIINAPLGYNTNGVMNIPAAVSDKTLDNTFMEELRKLPCVVNCSACDFTPVDGGNNFTKLDKVKNKSAQCFHADHAFFDVLGLKVIKDNGVKSAPRVWVNKKYTSEWADEYNTSHSLKDVFTDNTYPIAGVLADFQIKDITNDMSSVLIFEEKEVERVNNFLIKIQGDPVEAYDAVKHLYKETFHMELETDNPYIDQQIAQMFDREVRISTIVALFAFIAIVISMMGLVAMSTYFIQQRRREIAVRRVFGSTARQIRRRLIGSFMVFVVVAAVVAIPIAWYAMSQWIATYTYRISIAPWIIVACIACALISLAAVYIQSYMAAIENPINHIKDE